jgi:arylsulfatase A
LVADEAIRWLKEERKSDEPFFQFVCFHEPHEPVASPPELVSAYADKATTNDQAEYFANVANVDRAVGRLLAALDSLKLADDTLVLFTSDNGPETLNRYRSANRSYGSAAPLRGMKLHIYDGGIRVPGILRFPRHLQPGQTIAEPVCALDILPTFCELAGIAPPQDRILDGASFTALFEGQPIVRSKPLFWHYYRAYGKAKAALREGDWMIVGLWDGEPNAPGASLKPGDIRRIKQGKLVSFELYNVRKDIAQQHDLARQEPDRLRSMQADLQAAYTEALAAGPTWPEE